MADKSILELTLEKKKAELSITKAKTAKEEIDMKILETEVMVERMKEHSRLQDEVIENAKAEIQRVSQLLQQQK